nr:PREDICTED: protein indeterminate-domain 12-like [Daucus carota subsp. sativus]
MAASSSATLFGLKEEALKNFHHEQLEHSSAEGATPVVASSTPSAAASQRRKRNHPGNPSPDAEVIALSPDTLGATNRFMCEACDKGFKREQNLQLHRRGHNLPWKLKQKTSHEFKKKVYICPEPDCVHHDPSRALGDLTGIKKHFFRKHGEKKFICDKCNKAYAVHSDWKAHHKTCGTKDYICKCGTTFSRRDRFIFRRSFCEPLAEEVARHSILANATSPATTAGSLIPGNHQQLPSLFGTNSFTSLLLGQSVGSDFQSFQPPNSRLLQPVPEPKLNFPRDTDFSGTHGFPSYIAPSNMFNLGFDGDDDLNSPENDLDLAMNGSLTGLMMNAGASTYDILNGAPSTQFSATALLQKTTLAGGSSSNVTLMNSMGSTLSGGLKLDNYGGALGDRMSGGGRGGGSTFPADMYNNQNGSGGGTRGYRSGMEYFCDQVNAPYGEMMYNGKTADGILVGEQNNNAAMVEPQMMFGREYGENHTRDFFGMRNGMRTGGGMVADYSVNGSGTKSPDSKANTSAEARPFVPRRRGGF